MVRKKSKTGPHRAMIREKREENRMTYKTLLEKTEKIQKNAKHVPVITIILFTM